MPWFQKKPQRYEANQWTGPDCKIPGVQFSWVQDEQSVNGGGHVYYVVTAHNQRVYLVRGDWVVAEPDGRGHYPIKDSIFRTICDPIVG